MAAAVCTRTCERTRRTCGWRPVWLGVRVSAVSTRIRPERSGVRSRRRDRKAARRRRGGEREIRRVGRRQGVGARHVENWSPQCLVEKDAGAHGHGPQRLHVGVLVGSQRAVPRDGGVDLKDVYGRTHGAIIGQDSTPRVSARRNTPTVLGPPGATPTPETPPYTSSCCLLVQTRQSRRRTTRTDSGRRYGCRPDSLCRSCRWRRRTLRNGRCTAGIVAHLGAAGPRTGSGAREAYQRGETSGESHVDAYALVGATVGGLVG